MCTKSAFLDREDMICIVGDSALGCVKWLLFSGIEYLSLSGKILPFVILEDVDFVCSTTYRRLLFSIVLYSVFGGLGLDLTYM